jgi:hypothetical protein
MQLPRVTGMAGAVNSSRSEAQSKGSLAPRNFVAYATEIGSCPSCFQPAYLTLWPAHLANHLAASGFVLPHHITLDMPWSSSPLATKALRNLNHQGVR